MKALHVSHVVLAASLCLAFACDETNTAEPTAPSAQPVVRSKPRIERPTKPAVRPAPMARMGRRHFLEPAAMLLRTSMTAPGITDDQKTKLEALQTMGGEQMKGKLGPAGGHGEVQKAWIDSIKAGKVDAKMFDQHTEEMMKTMEEKGTARSKLLNDLHAALTPEQRKFLAQTVRERLAPREDAKDAAKEGTAAGKPPEEGKSNPKGPGGLEMKGRPGGPGTQPMGAHGLGRSAMRPYGFAFMRMARGLDLTEDQTKKLEKLNVKMEAERPTEAAIKAKHEAAKKNLLALLGAFEKDTFDATKLAISKPNNELSARMKKHMASFNAFLAILTEEQRAKVAERFEQRLERLPEHGNVNEYDEIVNEIEPAVRIPLPVRPMREPAKQPEKTPDESPEM